MTINEDQISLLIARHWGAEYQGTALREGPCFVVRLSPRARDEAPDLDPLCVLEGRSRESYADALQRLAQRVPPRFALDVPARVGDGPIRYVVRRSVRAPQP